MTALKFPVIGADICPMSSQCPLDLDEVAEAYILGTLSKAEASAFEKHYIGCPECASRLDFMEDFVASFRQAAERLRRTTEGRVGLGLYS